MMLWLSGNFRSDVVISATFSRITSSPGKNQLDNEKENRTSVFYERKSTQEKHSLQNFSSDLTKDQSEKLSKTNHPLNIKTD